MQRFGLISALFAVALLLVANIWKLWQQIDGGLFGIDFVWRSLQLMIQRENPYGIFLHEARHGVSNQGTPNYLIGGLLPIMPLGAMAEANARWVWLALNTGFAGGMIWLLQKRHPLSTPVLGFAILAFLAATPLRIVLLNCQTSLYVIFLLLLAQRISTRWPWLAGFLLALSLTKYSLTLPLAMWFGLKRERFPVIYWSAGWMLALTYMGAWWMKCGFLDALMGPIRLTATGGIALKLGASDLFSISNHAGVHSLAIPGITAMALLAFFHMVLMCRRNDVADEDVHGFLAVLSCLLFFHLTYDYVILLIPFWAGLRGLSGKSKPPVICGAVVVMTLIPWLPKDLWIKLSEHIPLIRSLGDQWWSMGFSELANFLALLGLTALLLPRVASRPSISGIKVALRIPARIS